MTTAETSTTEAVMSGHGFYNKHSVLQAAAIELALGELRAAAAEVPVPAAPQPLVVADYGCSQGQNSLRPMGEAITALRTRTEQPVTVVHTDLPANDFSSLFEVVANDPASYLRLDGATYVLAAGRSFYDQVLPPATVALGWSSVTTHWLSAVPCGVPGHVSPHSSEDPAVRAAFQQRAADDWRRFVAARGAELAPGGRIVLVEPCSHPDGLVGSEGLMSVMDEALGELVADGRADAGALAEATLPVWMRTQAEYDAPFDDACPLELVKSEVIQEWDNPLWTAFQQDGDAAAYATAAVDQMRAWSEAMLTPAMPDLAVRDAFYDRCVELGTVDPDRIHITTYQIILDLRRR